MAENETPTQEPTTLSPEMAAAIEAIEAQLPKDPAQLSRADLVVKTQLAIMRAAKSPHAVQQGLNMIARVWNLFKAEKDDGLDEDLRALAEDFRRLTQSTVRRVYGKNAKDGSQD